MRSYKKERAQEIINNINNKNKDDDTFKNAYSLINSGQEEKGIEEIRSFIVNNPKVWNAWFMLGWALRRLERYDDALLFLEQVVTSGGNFERVLQCRFLLAVIAAIIPAGPPPTTITFIKSPPQNS